MGLVLAVAEGARRRDDCEPRRDGDLHPHGRERHGPGLLPRETGDAVAEGSKGMAERKGGHGDSFDT